MRKTRILVTRTALAAALVVIGASLVPTWAPLQVPKLDDRSFEDLAEAVESLGDGLDSTARRPQRTAATGRASARQTPEADFGSMMKAGATGTACCGRQLQEVRETLDQVRRDRKRFAKLARAERNKKARKKVEQLDRQIRDFEKALDALQGAKNAKKANRQFATLSDVMKSMHDTAKAIIQNMRA